MIYIVPSRGRPHVMNDLIESWEKTRTFAKLHIAVDDDDETRDEYRRALKGAPPWVRWTLCASTGMNTALNYLAPWDATQEPIVGFMGDDHRPRTLGWDAAILRAWENGGRVIYCNDLIQRSNLPTQVALDSRIIQRLGFMALPTLKHLFLDNFWLMLGNRLSALTYLDDIVIEHMHPIAGKAEWDEGYVRVNDGHIYEVDGKTFAHYMESGLVDLDLARIGDLSGS